MSSQPVVAITWLVPWLVADLVIYLQGTPEHEPGGKKEEKTSNSNLNVIK